MKKNNHMCEILVAKHNKKGVHFEKAAILGALVSNNDGAGYSIFKKNKDKTYDLMDLQHYATKKYVKKEKYQSSNVTYTDFEWDIKTHSVILSTYTGLEVTLRYPKDMESIPPAKRREALEKWLTNCKINFDFDYNALLDNSNAELALAESFRTGAYQPELLPASNPTSNDDIAEDLYQKQLALEEHEVMIMHFRFATSGRTHEFTQPIISEQFITIHNGVFTSLGDHTQSDTDEFTQNLQMLYSLANIKNKTNEKSFIEAFLAITEGWYSTFIYSMKTKQLYYFKNGAEFHKYDDGLLYSTKQLRFPLRAESTEVFE